MVDPTAEDLALDLPALLAVCLDRLRHGWDDLPMFASATQNIAALCRRCLAAEAEVARLREACIGQQHEIQQVLGKALGYPVAGPEVDGDGSGVCVGEHIAETLAAEAAAEIARLQGIVEGLCRRIGGQAEVIARMAEKGATG